MLHALYGVVIGTGHAGGNLDGKRKVLHLGGVVVILHHIHCLGDLQNSRIVGVGNGHFQRCVHSQLVCLLGGVSGVIAPGQIPFADRVLGSRQTVDGDALASFQRKPQHIGPGRFR